ncbi:hypothetical protein LSAT2_011396 [Lamellibrachia satsuma]|nr:hypothetical protein LSAT2_011396 [Lamellibrachia satsuma]
MSCEIVVRQCERCDLTEGTVLCQECAGKEESDPVCYCGTCSDLVHKGRIAKHTLTFVKTDVSKVNKDEAESLITKYKRQLSCLSKKIDEVEKAKENVNEFMQKHDKAIRQTITAVVRQLQERGKCFIQQVAARSSEKKEQLTGIQAQLQDAQSGINQQICNLEEILKKLESRDKLEIASIEAAMKETETEVQGKIDETFKTVKLPELDTEFDIDTNSVVEAVQALEINIHPEPSDEIVADRNNIEVPKLNISKDGEEKPMIEAFVSGPLMRNSVFWVVPHFTKEVESKLHRLSTLIRKVYIENPAWKSFDDSGTQPTVGDDVYALYDADHKWYRGRVEDTKSSRNGSTVRFTDYGNTQNVMHANMLPASDSLVPRCHQQAMRCCLQETLEKLLPNEARWAFSDATGDTVLNLTFQKQVKRDGVDAWLTDVKVPLPDGTFNDVNALIMEKVIEDNNPKSTITCKGHPLCQREPFVRHPGTREGERRW